MAERVERHLWREHKTLKIWIEYLAIFEDEKLVRLWNLTNDCEIPLRTRTARRIARRHERYHISPPAEAVAIPPSAKMRYAQRHKTARYTSA